MQELIDTLSEQNSLKVGLGDFTIVGLSAPGWFFLLLILMTVIAMIAYFRKKHRQD